MHPLVIVSLTQTVALVVLLAIVVVQLRSERRLRQLASTDPLTGLMNRREFDRALAVEISRASRTGDSFALLLIDIDGLKAINDRCGHRIGDRAIRRVGRVLQATFRQPDTTARLGGDEFAVLLPSTEERSAIQCSARVRAALAQHRRLSFVTVSTGVAEYPRDASTADELFDVADLALYGAKHRRKDFSGGVIHVTRN